MCGACAFSVSVACVYMCGVFSVSVGLCVCASSRLMIQHPTLGGPRGQPPSSSHAPLGAPVGVSKEELPEKTEEKGVGSILPSVEPRQKEQLGEERQRQLVTECDHSELMDTNGGRTAVSTQEDEGGCVRVSKGEREMIEGESSGVRECGGSNAMNEQRVKKGEPESRQMVATGEGGVSQQDRHYVIYHNSFLPETPKEDLPDEFYQVTIDDVLVMQRDLKAKADSFDAPLETRAMRQTSNSASQAAERYIKVCCVVKYMEGTSHHQPLC